MLYFYISIISIYYLYSIPISISLVQVVRLHQTRGRSVVVGAEEEIAMVFSIYLYISSIYALSSASF